MNRARRPVGEQPLIKLFHFDGNRSLRRPPTACKEELDHDGHERDDNDSEDDDWESLFDPGQAAEIIAAQQEQQDPNRTTRYVINGELSVGHLSNARDEGSKRADNRKKPSQEDRFAA